ncbi:MAG TPA: sugar phosphate isomerase/epimerase [Candidatus Acidoferrales bacterium]|jgi:sugar phosphate isomerase/epimerase|nr:sugar phosphate isomerase/epimerase [Candidatus Acidoferrales bacterium]
MRRILSTYRYVHQPLSREMLQGIAQAGIHGVEIFCASSHFTYRSMEAIRELAGALEETRLTLHSLHSPTERNSSPGRESGIPISISETERVRRVDAVDEVKRAIDVAETVPFRYLVQHLGTGRQDADPRKYDAAFSSLEHLSLFAKQRGVTIAVENTPNELGAPASLVQFVKETRLDLKFCFDIGHAHLDAGVAESFELMRARVATTHIHDNHGEKDEHLLPYAGTIDWDAALSAFAGAEEPFPLVLELKEQAGGVPGVDQIRATFDKLEEHAEKKGVASPEKWNQV